MTALALLATALAAATVAAAGTRSYRNDAARVRAFEPPIGWEPQTNGSYPRLLAAYEDKGGARLTLAAQRVAPGTTARALADESRPALVRQGFAAITVTVDPEERAKLEASIDGGRRFVRQLYLVNEGMGYVVTMVGPSTRSFSLKRDFDEAVETLQVGDTGDGGAPSRR